MWDDLCAELGFGFARVGEPHRRARRATTCRRSTGCSGHAEAKGVPGVEQWDRERVAARRAATSTPSVVAAVHAPTTAVINPYEACFGLAESAAATACRDPHRLRRARPRATMATRGRSPRPDGPVHARFVLNAAGVHAGAVAAHGRRRGYSRASPARGRSTCSTSACAAWCSRVDLPVPVADEQGHAGHPHLRRHDHDRPHRRRGRRSRRRDHHRRRRRARARGRPATGARHQRARRHRRVRRHAGGARRRGLPHRADGRPRLLQRGRHPVARSDRRAGHRGDGGRPAALPPGWNCTEAPPTPAPLPAAGALRRALRPPSSSASPPHDPRYRPDRVPLRDRHRGARCATRSTAARARSTASSSAPERAWAAARVASARRGAWSCCRASSGIPLTAVTKRGGGSWLVVDRSDRRAHAGGSAP